jgi:flagellar motor component MotA
MIKWFIGLVISAISIIVGILLTGLKILELFSPLSMIIILGGFAVNLISVLMITIKSYE